jgi:hypothetical protein
MLASGCRAGLLALWSPRWPDVPRATFELGDRVEAIAWPSHDRVVATVGDRLVAIKIDHAAERGPRAVRAGR